MGTWEDIRQVGKKGEKWCQDNLVGTSVVNPDTGWSVRFSNMGTKKVGSGKGEDLYRIVPVLARVLDAGSLQSTEVDNRGRPEVEAVHKIAARITLAGVEKDVIATIRETNDGTSQYDLSRDMGDGARFMRRDGNAAAVRMGEAQVRSPALEGDPVKVNLDFASSVINTYGRITDDAVASTCLPS